MTHNELPLFYVFHFYFFGLVAIISAVAFVTRKSPVAAAMWLVSVKLKESRRHHSNS